MEDSKQGKHFVLVHGMGQGAWCWYKLIALLKKAGHRVTALDMAASGINMESIEEVRTFEEYTKPLLDFMSSVSNDEKVILVGHSLGGMNIAFAMEKFPEKISAGVFLTAFLPDTVHQPSFVLEKFAESIPEENWLDTEFWTHRPNSPEGPLITTLVGPQFLKFLSHLSPQEDFELAKILQRPSSMFIPDLSKEKKFSEEHYGSVRQTFVICKEDKGFREEFVRWMIENNGTKEVKEIRDADHMPMFSQPQLLCNCLIEIADCS